MENFPLITIRDLHVHFYTRHGIIHALNGVNLSIREGEATSIVGESGCGKTMTALSILRLVPGPVGKIVQGEIKFEGKNILTLSEKEMRRVRGNKISIIFQDPMTSLNPVFTVRNQLAEIFYLHWKALTKKEIRDRCMQMLKLVEMPMPEIRLNQYPHELSGGMRQRVMIASALACNPKILIADEPTTALDVTIQAQILELMHKLMEESNTAVILITHNLALVAEHMKRVIVMYAGQVVEKGPVDEVIDHPFHPYTKGLFRSIPRMSDDFSEMKRKLYEIPGVVPSLTSPPVRCIFFPRCSRRMKICEQEVPEMKDVGLDHHVWCWL